MNDNDIELTQAQLEDCERAISVLAFILQRFSLAYHISAHSTAVDVLMEMEHAGITMVVGAPGANAG